MRSFMASVYSKVEKSELFKSGICMIPIGLDFFFKTNLSRGLFHQNSGLQFFLKNVEIFQDLSRGVDEFFVQQEKSINFFTL